MSTTPVTPEITIANTAEEIRTAMEAQVTPAAPTPIATPAPPPAEWGQMSRSDDGQYEVKLATGEVFKGTPEEVIQKQSEAFYNTKRWGQDWKQKAEAAQPAAPVVPAPVENPEEVATQKWMIEQVAKGLNIPPDKFPEIVQQMYENTQKFAMNAAWFDFCQSCRDYQDTAENANALAEYLPAEVVSKQRAITAADLKTAHANALYDKKYAPASSAEVTPAVPRAPVMPSSGTGSQPNQPNPWTMPKEELKKLAFGQ